MGTSKVRWGILGAAKIARTKVIPAIGRSEFGTVQAIASRSLESASRSAGTMDIPLAFGSYEDLLASPEIDAVYIPLPNTLHVKWSVAALRAGKHVLCEKPIAMTVEEARQLADAARIAPELKVMEAFMYRSHPQWQKVLELVQGGAIGEVRTIHSFFAYSNMDAANIRNKPETGGGALLDIGCYGVSIARYLAGKEPVRVCALADVDPKLGTDRVFSAMLDFGNCMASFTSSTQAEHMQRVEILGSAGRMDLYNPFNPLPTDECSIELYRGKERTVLTVPAADQYTLQADAFCKAILNQTPVPTPLADAVNNMAVLAALQQSAEEDRWVQPQ